MVAWTGFVCLACNVLMQVTCNSGFLLLGVEMHFLLVCSRFPAFPGSRVFLVLRFPRRGPCFEFVRYWRLAYQAGNRPARPALISAVCSFIRFYLQSVFSVVRCIVSEAITPSGKKDIYMTLQEYIEARELSLLWVFNGTTYYEDQMGNAVSLQQIERQFYDSLKA